ncbi:MAG: hypothetical protein ACON42_07785 [Flavobacteriaceae bacterium]
MGSAVLFLIGLAIFGAVLLAARYSITEKRLEDQKKLEVDRMDYDGGGNFGRIPDTKPKSRA